MHKIGLYICLYFFIFISEPVFAQMENVEIDQIPVQSENTSNNKFSIEAGPEAYFGYTLYQIGGIIEYPDGSKERTWFPLSELRFPLDVFMISGNIRFSPNEKYSVNINVKKNITEKAGKMEDSDWGIFPPYNPDSLDVYSESDAKLDAIILNGTFRIRTYHNDFFSLYAGPGFMYQKFNYDVSDLDQTYPSAYPGYHDYVSGKVLTYSIDYYIPYAEITPVFNISNRIRIAHSFALSPYTIAKDIDDHLLRYKKSEGDSSGMAFMTTVKADLLFATSPVFCSFVINYIYISAKGHQEQYQYREYYDSYYSRTIPVGPIGKIENKIKSSQFSMGINAGVRF